MRKVILLVDDDPGFRALLGDFLGKEGYAVIVAEGGLQAMALIKREPIDLVITDILMPGIEGNALAYHIWEIKPKLKVIGMTGGGRIGSAGTVSSLCPDFLFQSLLHKPFLAEELRCEVLRSFV